MFLALGSLAIALVLGTLLAWAASRLPRRLGFLRVLPILPIVVPAIANVVGWAFLFSPRPGLPQRPPAQAAVVVRTSTEGPIDIYTMPWIIIITGFGLTSFVYLFVSAGFDNISAEHLEAAQVAGSSTWGVFFKVILPLLRPTLIYGGGVALLLGLGQFTAPLLLGRNGGIDVITTNMYSAMTAYPTQYGTAAALGSPLLLLGIVVVGVPEAAARQPAPLRHPHRQGVPLAEAKGSKLAALGIVLYSTMATILPIAALAIVSLTRFWSAKIVAEQVHPGELPPPVRHEHDHRCHQEQRVLRDPRRADLPAGRLHRRQHPVAAARLPGRCARSSTSSCRCRSACPPWCSAPASC